MHAQIVKRALLACFALLFAVAMAGAVQAGPLQFSVSKAQAGGVGQGQQEIVFHYTVTNTTSHEFIRRLNSVTVEVTGDLGNGRQEKYTREVRINYTFNPALGPRMRQGLRSWFHRKIDPRRGWYPYRRVWIRVLRYNFTRAS